MAVLFLLLFFCLLFSFRFFFFLFLIRAARDTFRLVSFATLLFSPFLFLFSKQMSNICEYVISDTFVDAPGCI